MAHVKNDAISLDDSDIDELQAMLTDDEYDADLDSAWNVQIHDVQINKNKMWK